MISKTLKSVFKFNIFSLRDVLQLLLRSQTDVGSDFVFDTCSQCDIELIILFCVIFTLLNMGEIIPIA